MIESSARISFIFGAGASLPSSLPSTQEITTRVLSGEGVWRHTDECYYMGSPPSGMPDEYVPKVRSFLHVLQTLVDVYYRRYPDRTTSYEDLYYVASQIHDSESGEYDNPAVGPLLAQIRGDSSRILKGSPYDHTSEWRLIDLSSEACNYIHDIAYRRLSTPPTTTAQYDLLADCSADKRFARVNVFTLNHDTTLERHLTNRGRPFVDGFGTMTGGLRPWRPVLYDSAEEGVLRLYKLHGSVNWYWFQERSDQVFGIITGDPWSVSGSHGQLLLPTEGRPVMLLGRFNKMLEYSKAVFDDIHYRFSQAMRTTDYLVISGTSFNDKGINSSILAWSNDHARAKRMVIIHPDLEGLKRSARPAISKELDAWMKSGLLKFIVKGIQDVNWDEVSGQL